MPDIHIDEVSDGLYLLRIDDDKVRYFEAIWPIPMGITYNAYLLKGGGEAVLFDGWKQDYSREFIESINEIVSPKKITHIIIHHMEPDHTGTLPALLSIENLRPKILIHPLGKGMLRSFYQVDEEVEEIDDGEERRLAGKSMKFIHTPWLHWPETLMTYIREGSVLLSGDAFGGYSIPSKLYDEDEEIVSRYLPEVRKYVATVIGRYRDHIVKNIEKLKALGIEPETIAPLHGIIWRRRPELIAEYYMKLANGVAENGKILVIYGSMYGACREAAEYAAGELSGRGYSPVIYGFTDSSQASFTEIIGDAMDSEAIIIAAPTYENDIFPKIRHLIEIMRTKIPAKPTLIISSHGWAAIAGKKMRDLMAEKGFEIIDVIEFRGRIDREFSDNIRRGIAELIERIEGHED